ncbi:murein hydrolase activator EnvC family protein [Pseudoroseicyclus tamaricis]|uniref:Peptidoglycan DD-metalloendopeptidase family protein n=1 Tax=Pseudoroseicyclus tamaricis TaxID=2705421 RepID=A0A6B2K5M4_9RHOB|nr:peptidoglycan DD-metalloendopeptidase family protein [Pseudoroseicyclus tamaricis]NDV02086.1 peptidoglycan DD-metalloendopeptidase family protein [Pseudoroseicyclus tamaricis]
MTGRRRPPAPPLALFQILRGGRRRGAAPPSVLAALAVLTLLAAPAAAQQGTAAAAEAAAASLRAAESQLAAAGTASDRVAALTETVRAYEEGLATLREGLRRAAIRQQALEAELDASSGEISALLAMLQTMGRAPAPLLLLHPSGPLGTARAGMMISELTPALQQEVEALRAKLTEVEELRLLQAGAASTLEDGLRGAQEARAALSSAIADRTDLPRKFIEDPISTALLIASTDTLDGFAAGLGQVIDEELAGAAPDAAELKGSLPLPVPGEVIRRFGEADAAGIARPGLILATRPRALVTAPAAATIRFRGQLLDYGNVVILEPSPGILIVLAGLGEVFGQAGQIVPQGEPVGLMGGDPPAADAILTESAQGLGATRPETLYVEVRDAQTPIDPAEWFDLGQ